MHLSRLMHLSRPVHPEVDARRALEATARPPMDPMPAGLHHCLVVTALLRHLPGVSALPALSAGAMADTGAALPLHLLRTVLTAPEASAPQNASLREHRAGMVHLLLTSGAVHALLLSSRLAANTTAATPTVLRKALLTTPTTPVPCPAARRALLVLSPTPGTIIASALAALLRSPGPTLATTLAPDLPLPPPLSPPASAPS